jgi:hypothetical protein
MFLFQVIYLLQMIAFEDGVLLPQLSQLNLQLVVLLLKLSGVFVLFLKLRLVI